MARNVAIFVDVANVFYAAKAAGVDIDYVTLLKTLTANRDLVRAYAYTGLDPDNENQKAFHNFLARNNYKVVSKDVRKYGDGRFKANLDIELVVDLVRLAPKLDIAVVISGDGDFAPAIRAVQDMGVRVEVVSFRANTSSDLVDVADQFIEITNIAKVEAGARSGRRVAAEGEEDLSMTEVPDKQSEAPARPRRVGAAPERERVRGGRGGRTAAPRTGTPVRRSSAIRVGDTMIDADSIETLTLDDLGPDDLAAGAEPSPHNHESSAAFGEDGPRRRRRRGGRGRRGRGGVGGDSLDGIETMTLDDADDGAPGGVPEYLATERRAPAGRGPVRAARQQLGSGPSRIADEVSFGGITFRRYRGGAGFGVATDKAVFYPEAVDGLFEIYHAPADTFETVNTLGQPLYARMIPDRDRDEWVQLEIELNPLPICTRPQVLRSARRT
jgi:uncharacterized LabA/DUF88 family protein